jgi:hypothetical protein
MTRRPYTILSLSHAAEAAGFATACSFDPMERVQTPLPRRLAEMISTRLEGLRTVLASISIL